MQGKYANELSHTPLLKGWRPDNHIYNNYNTQKKKDTKSNNKLHYIHYVGHLGCTPANICASSSWVLLMSASTRGSTVGAGTGAAGISDWTADFGR